ncbi:MAG: hypothetical protein N2712_07240 [Brevinematales bacterium]|nr:hypothetical protein [Brevinematales bacterium]
MRFVISLLLVMISTFSFGFVYNISYFTNANNIVVEWLGPTNVSGSLYYNIYSSTNKPKVVGKKIVNFEELNLIKVVQFSTNLQKFYFTDELQSNTYYTVIPVFDGRYVYDYIDLSIIPSKLVVSLSNYETNLVFVSPIQTNVLSVTQTNFVDFSVQQDDFSEELDFKKVLRDYFLKKDYKLTISRLKEIRKNTQNDIDRDYINLYLARSYYAINKKRKAIYILLNIKSDEVRPLAEFWLDRFSRYLR